jgi:hypothetical protein
VILSCVANGCNHSDELKQVPDQLETLIGDKKFLQAALILVRSIKTINKPEIAEIGALSDLRTYFTSQESVSRMVCCQPGLTPLVDVIGHTGGRATYPSIPQDVLQ